MRKEEIKLIVYLSIALAAILTLTYLAVFSTKIELIAVFRGVSFSITALTLFWTFYFTYGWTFWPFNKLFYRPNINGTWAGKLISDYKDENGNSIPPIDFYIVIRQSFIRIHFTTLTKDFVGLSYAETFTLDKDTGLKSIAYLYRKDTSQLDDNTLREGATELRLILSKDEKRLEGKYWSNIKTQGSISVSFLNFKQVDSYDHAQKIKI
ncbi:MAG: hypothetical protein WBP31_11840 [Chitinophagales bacterium]|nr:hypothetical protein [Bacteroidota bacterium]